MSDTNASASGAHAEGHSSHPDSYYIKIWGFLLVLLVVSVIGPEIGRITNLKVITLITAFGIAIVKAYMVLKNFMHIGVERKWVAYILVTMMALMVLMVGGVGPDVLRHEGHRWKNVGAEAARERAEKAAASEAAHPTAH
jgi:caa(3)-type oxidase subunit IV